MTTNPYASPWTEVDNGEGTSLMETYCTYGGDVQIGRAFSRRWHHATLPGRVVDIVAYPIEAIGPGDGEKSIALECQQHMTVCTDIDDPGSTEVWADVTYVDLPERFDHAYPSVGHAEIAARNLVTSMEAQHIGWDGAPGAHPADD